MTPTKEQVAQAREWLGQYDAIGIGFEWRTATSELLATYAAQRVAEATAEKDRRIKMLELKASNSLANNLCPDHRDKQVGKSCLACTIEQKDAEIARLRDALKPFAVAAPHIMDVGPSLPANKQFLWSVNLGAEGFVAITKADMLKARAALQETAP